MSSSIVLSSLKLRGLTIPNRVAMPPMCTWMAESGTGLANDQHLLHYASAAEAGIGLIIMEAVSVQARGYISPCDLGLWDDSQTEGMKRITDYVHQRTQSKIAVQLNHAGPKGLMSAATSTSPKQLGMEDEFGGELIAASAQPFGNYRTPREMTIQDIELLKESFVQSAKRAVAAGFDAIEIHGAHGFLLHNFYSPLTNKRQGEYGGSFENRIRLILEVAELIRKAIPDSMPLLCRLSCTDWVEGGWSIEDSVKLSKQLKAKGVDMIDCSSGGASSEQDIQVGFHYQVPFAETIKQEADIHTIAVGGIESIVEIENILRDNGADMVAVGRATLRNAYWFRSQVMKMNVIPWHPARQMMGFMASLRRQAKQQQQEQAAKAQVSSDQPEELTQSAQAAN